MRIELRLDTRDINACFLVASADDRDWVDASFNGLTDLLRRQRSLSRLVHTAWTGLVVQLFGLVLGFVLSVWIGMKIAPHLKIENSFAISFIFAFLVFSNIWMYLNPRLPTAHQFLVSESSLREKRRLPLAHSRFGRNGCRSTCALCAFQSLRMGRERTGNVHRQIGEGTARRSGKWCDSERFLKWPRRISFA